MNINRDTGMGILLHTDTIQTRTDTIRTRTDTVRTKTDTRPDEA